jgi:hypothetical protein
MNAPLNKQTTLTIEGGMTKIRTKHKNHDDIMQLRNDKINGVQVDSKIRFVGKRFLIFVAVGILGGLAHYLYDTQFLGYNPNPTIISAIVAGVTLIGIPFSFGKERVLRILLDARTTTTSISIPIDNTASEDSLLQVIDILTTYQPEQKEQHTTYSKVAEIITETMEESPVQPVLDIEPEPELQDFEPTPVKEDSDPTPEPVEIEPEETIEEDLQEQQESSLNPTESEVLEVVEETFVSVESMLDQEPEEELEPEQMKTEEPEPVHEPEEVVTAMDFAAEPTESEPEQTEPKPEEMITPVDAKEPEELQPVQEETQVESEQETPSVESEKPEEEQSVETGRDPETVAYITKELYTYTVAELRDIAKAQGMKNYTKYRKADLISFMIDHDVVLP